MPVLSVVWLPVITGFVVVLQHTPRAVTVAPPSEVTLPPLAAVVSVIEVIADVVTVGIEVKINVIVLFEVGTSIIIAV